MKKRSLGIIITLLAVFLLSACRETGGTQGIKLLDNASPETSAMALYYFDGEKTEMKWLFDQDEEEKIIDEINKLNIRSADSSKIADIKAPCYGIGISDKEGYDICLSYCDGLWLTKDGSVYKANYNLKKLYDKTSYAGDSYDGGLMFPNAALLGEYDVSFYQKAEDLPGEKDGISLSFVSFEDNIVTLSIKNDSDSDFLYGEYYSLQKKIDGEWYTLPMKMTNYGFVAIGLLLRAGETTEETCDLFPYGTLEKGIYRIEKEGLAAEFEVQ
ncbi:MAG: hypothetical protein J6X80_10070 [Lachnospiraceae bacterium]|nr:hypothetical protein [Lachnospiraceae bacterium]